MTSISTLQLERLRRSSGISLEQIADRTKISTTFLRAIETGQFEKLPGGVFDVNYIRQYAQVVGLDPQEVLDQYHQARLARELEAKSAEQGVRTARSRWSARWMDWFRSPSPVIRS